MYVDTRKVVKVESQSRLSDLKSSEPAEQMY